MNSIRMMLLCSVAATAGWGTAAMAQDAESGASLGDIVVTAQRREQALQDVPLAVTAIGTAQLETRGVSALSDFATGAVPGVQIAPFAGSATTLSISARGIGAPDATQSTQELPVPVYLDGVPLGRGQGLGLELIDPERVEFLRGPQGQLFGRNAQGGAVQFVSRRPSGKFSFDAKASIGNYGLDTQRLRVDLPEFANIRLQASIARTQRDGYTKNSETIVYPVQRDWNEMDSLGFRIAAEWAPFDGLRVNYAYDDADIDDTQSYLTWVPVSINGRTPFSPQPAFNGQFPDRANSPTFHDGFNTKTSGHGLTVQYDVSDAITLKSITSLRETSRHGSGSLADALVAGVRLLPPSPAPRILTTIAQEDVEQEQTYQEFQILGSWDNFDITFGGSYFNEKVDDQRRSQLQGPGLALGTIPLPIGSFDAFQNCLGLLLCQTARSEQNAESDSYGVYSQATYTPPILDGKLELTAGVRYTDDKKVAERTYISVGLPNSIAVSNAAPSGPLPPPSIFREKRWDPAFVVKYNFTDAVNVYFRYATGYRAGGANVRSSAFASYGAEEVEAFELGMKGRFFDNRVTFNVSAYQNNVTGRQITFQEAPTTNPALTSTVNDTGKTKTKGFEVETSIRVADGLVLSGNYAYMDTPQVVEIDNALTPVFDLTRFYSTQTPKHSGNVALDYTADLNDAELRFHLDYSFASAHHITGAGQLVASFAPGYVRPTTKTKMLNGRFSIAEIDVGPAQAEVTLFGKNLLDETQFIFGFDGAASGGGFAQFIQAPRTYGLELRLKM